MRFVRQKQGLGTCGAVAFAAIFDTNELQACRECKTDLHKGTKHGNFIAAVAARGVQCYDLPGVRGTLKQLWWLRALSHHWPIYASTGTHAIAISSGLVYDGHLDGPMPMELYFGRKVIRDLVLVERENPGFGSPDENVM